MKLCTFSHAGATRLGVVVDDEIVDLAAAAPELPQEMIRPARGGRARASAAAEAAARATSRLPLDAVHLCAAHPASAQVPRDRPQLRRPRRRGRARDGPPSRRSSTSSRPASPVRTTPVHLPRVSTALDYEGELGFVIGRRCRHVPRARAHEVIAGYLVVNDVTVRDWQLRIPTWTMGKSFDTHGPLGPVAHHERRGRRSARRSRCAPG